MAAPQFDPVQEQVVLSSAIAILLRSWGKPGMAQAIAKLRHALVHAEHALAALEQEPERDTAFAVQVLGLGFQVTYAQEEIKQAEQFARETLAGRGAKEGPSDA